MEREGASSSHEKLYGGQLADFSKQNMQVRRQQNATVKMARQRKLYWKNSEKMTVDFKVKGKI